MIHVTVLLIALFSCSAYSVSFPDVVYGEDDRKDTFEVTSSLHQELAKSTAAQIHEDFITIRGNTAEINAKPLSEFNMGQSLVCEKERFSHQPTAANCSGFLVADDIIATAGHCMKSQSDCAEFKWVFNYKVSDAHQSSISVSSSDVFRCSKIIKQAYTAPPNRLDFALVKLDRPVNGKLVKIAKKDPLVGTSLVMIGHPTGLPQKVTDGARIVSINSFGYLTDLDAFGGNSGSAVFNAQSGELLGILSSGRNDYDHNEALGCTEVSVVTHDMAGEEVASFRQILDYLH